jgi:hypothetical protein
MLLSTNSFFKQRKSRLDRKREIVQYYLKMKAVDPEKYLIAYDYFAIHRNKFDGATLVKDLNDIPELDLNAMLHDYRYLTDFGPLKKFKWDWEYLQGMNDLGKGYRVGRFVALLLSSIFFIPYKLLKRK